MACGGPPSCRLCTLNCKLKLALNSDDVARKNSLIEELADELICAEDDLARLQAILDGVWPSARRYLEYGLEKVKEREANEIQSGRDHRV